MTETPADPPPTSSAADSSGRVRRLPPWPVIGVVVLLLAGVAWCVRPDRPDRLIGNAMAAIYSVLIVVILGAWFVWFSGYARRTRWTVLSLGLAVVIGFFAVFRVDELSGFNVPVLAFRWSPRPEELIDVPTPGSDDGLVRVDLSVTSATDFPQFLGPAGDLAIGGVALARDWEARPPQLVWKQRIGAGWSAFSAVNGYAVTLEQRGENELVTCYEVKTGELVWQHGSEVRHDTVMGGLGPRSTPTIADGRVYAVGATGLFYCLDGATGQVVWEKDLISEFNSTPEQEAAAIAWGRAGSPLVVDNLVIVPAGGPDDASAVSLVAYDRVTGNEVWRGGSYQISYATPSVTTLAGTRQLLSVNQGFVTAHDPSSGAVLWEHEWPSMSNSRASCSQAIGVDGSSVFVSKGYGQGAMLLDLSRGEDGTWQSTERWSNRTMKTRFTNVTIDGDYVYGLDDGILQCIEVATGDKQWKRGRYGNGQLLRIGSLLVVLGEFGELILVEANPERHVELGQIQAIEGKTWNNLCYSAPYLLVRNAHEAACFELALAKE